MSLPLIIFILISSTIFALLEIQIEGENGWAEKLPTWKIKNPLKRFITWPYISGYHIFLWTFIFVTFHFPLFLGLTFNIKNEILTIETIFSILILEDMLWFILNPKWGIKKFLKNEIHWHSGKILFLPKNQWIGLIILVIIELIRRNIYY